jgi:KDO2-lipid IV(A) lauroyltransferase
VRRRKKIKRNLEVAATRGLWRFARALPRSAGFKLFSAIGGAAGYLLRRDRQRAIDNLGIAFPDMPLSFRTAMTNAMFRSLGRNAYEFLTLEGSSKARLLQLVERVEGQEHLDEAYGRQRGLIAITGHIGCWELLAAYFVQRGYPVNVVGRELWEKRLNSDLIRVRESMGYHTIDRATGGRRMLRILRDKSVVAVLIDQHTRVDGVYVPFFNRPAHTPTGVAKLAQATGVPILPMAIFMIEPGRHVIRILPVIECDGREDREREIEVVTEKCSRAIEELVRFDPKQWVWFHRRWRDEEKARIDATVN